MAASDDGDRMAFIGHMQNFMVDGVDVISLLRRHTSSYPRPANDPEPAHSVLANSGELTFRELPIPVNPVTLTASSAQRAFLSLPTLDLSHGNASLKFMFRTLVSNNK